MSGPRFYTNGMIFEHTVDPDGLVFLISREPTGWEWACVMHVHPDIGFPRGTATYNAFKEHLELFINLFGRTE